MQLINGAYRSSPEQAGWTSEGHLLSGPRTDAAALQELITKPAATIFTYRDETQELKGCIFLQPQRGTLYLGLLAVQPAAQAAGIGKKLLAFAEVHAKRYACLSITITVLSARPELAAWYERHGFRATGHTQALPVEDRFGVANRELTLVEMRKELD
ncbi:hypothetical protein ASU33_12385 [Solirubrum puertoriconensis]|uniref:N-acetyltransferase domain-containing protein n=1 Tax=Solirubrum puertoriconensis TaxID=1751427 RepID=A0A9X0HJM5_SOLP1|nr:hypothetical protein ASU33_12385 [Solirubrum puertoriconensis]